MTPSTSAARPSPSALQLRRLGFRSPPSSLARFRRAIPFPLARFAIKPEVGFDARRSRLIVAEASPGSFAGWANDGGGEEDGNKGGFGGILGAGLAGFFFAAGVTYAAVSLTRRNASGAKLQMKPLSREQAVDICTNVSAEGGTGLLPTDTKISNTLEGNTGTHKDLSVDHINESSDKALDSGYGTESSSLDEALSAPSAVDATSEHANLNVNDVLSTPFINECCNSENLMSHSFEVVEHSNNLSGITPEDSKNINYSVVMEDVITKTSVTGQQEQFFDTGDYLLDAPNNSKPLSEPQSGDVVAISNSENVSDSAASVPKEQVVELNDIKSHPDHYDKDETFPGMLNDMETYRGKAAGFPDDSDSSLFGNSAANSALEESLFGVDPNKKVALDPSKQHETLEVHFFNKSHDLDVSGKPFSPGIPAPTKLSAALQVPPGKVLIPAAVDQTQGHALAALQVLKVIEANAQPGDLCTRREYARWLVVASHFLSKSNASKVYPAMYIENVTELAFDDVTPDDPDFPSIQGLAEAGLVSSKLSQSDTNSSVNDQNANRLFSPESPLSRQDLVSWKMAVENRQLPEVDRESLLKCSGYIDIDKINPDAWPALAADLAAGDQSVTALAFGFTRLFQPDKPVTKGQAALALSVGDAAEVVSEEYARVEAEKIAEAAVNAHNVLVAQVENDLHNSFERELANEREKVELLEKLAAEARAELDKLRAEREEEKNALIRGRAAVESEMELLSKLRSDAEEQLLTVMSSKLEISMDRDRINKLQKEIEKENQAIINLQHELEVERKALSMARAWAEDEAKRAREQVMALEAARLQWEQQGIKVVVDRDLQDDQSAGVTWITAGKEHPVDEVINRAESLATKLKSMAAGFKARCPRSLSVIERLIQQVQLFISKVKRQVAEAVKCTIDLSNSAIVAAQKKADDLQNGAAQLGSRVVDKTKRVVEDCKGGMEKITQRFKT